MDDPEELDEELGCIVPLDEELLDEVVDDPEELDEELLLDAAVDEPDELEDDGVPLDEEVLMTEDVDFLTHIAYCGLYLKLFEVIIKFKSLVLTNVGSFVVSSEDQI